MCTDGGDALHGPLPRLPWFSILSAPAVPWCSLVRAGKVSGRTARGAFLQPGNTLSSKRSGFVRLHLRRPSYCGGNLHKKCRRDRTVKKQDTMGRVQLCPDEKAVMLCRNGSPPKPTVGRRHPRHLMALGNAFQPITVEALTNAAKHARASVVEVCAEATDSHLQLEIRDDGIGGAAPGKGSGLTGLVDRVAALGGTITIQSQPGSGTSLLVGIPIESD